MPAIRALSHIAAFIARSSLFLVGPIVLILTWVAWQSPIFHYDGWLYHLPFAAYLWNLGGGEAGYILPPPINSYVGFPKFVEWLQGAGWVLAGSVRGTILPNVLIGACLVAYTAKYLKINPTYLIPAILAFPVIALHYQSDYIDFFLGCMMTIEITAAFVLIRLLKLKSSPLVRQQIVLHFLIMCASGAAACASKVLAIPLAFIIAGFVLLKLILASRRFHAPRRFYMLLVVIALSATVAAGWKYVANAIEFSNPLFPFYWSIGPFSFEGKYNQDQNISWQPGYLPVSVFTRPALFILSATEIDWWIRGVEPFYETTMSAGDEGWTLMRTGGLYGPYVIFLLGVFGALLFKLGKLRSKPRRSVCRDQMFLFALVTLGIMFLPMCHEIRYNLVWPMGLVLCIGVLLRVVRPGWGQWAGCLAVVFCLHNLLALNLVSNPFSRGYVDFSPAEIRKTMSPDLLEAVDKASHTICLISLLQPRHFLYSAAMIGGTHVIRSILDDKVPEECRSKKHVILYENPRNHYSRTPPGGAD